MAIPANIQALVAAFTFGIVLNAASAALFLTIKGHGSAIYRDGLRLVLTTFLFGAALWAQIGFITTAIDVTAATSCEVSALFTTVFDQLARFSIEQYLLWAINRSSPQKAGWAQLVPQLLLLGRAVLGAVFVGFTRRQTVGVCAPVSSVLGLAVVTVVYDAVVVTLLAGLAASAGLVASAREGVARSKAILMTLGGVAIWTATSVTLLIGLQSIEVLFRTAIPALGLSLLIIIVTAWTDSLVDLPRARVSRPPESPRRDLDTRDLSTSGSDEYPPIRYEDLKRAEVTMMNAFTQPREAPRIQPSADGGIPQIAPAVTGVSGVGGVPIQGALFPPPRAATEPVDVGSRRTVIQQQPQQQQGPGHRQKRSLFDMRGGPAQHVTLGKLAISKPIIESEGAQNPLNKIATIDLETAATLERERREQALQAQIVRDAGSMQLQRDSALIAKRPAPQPPAAGAATPEEGLLRAVSLKRKGVASVGSQSQSQSAFGPSLEPNHAAAATASTTSAQLSPGVEEMRRRSPRHPPQVPARTPSASSRPVSPPKEEPSVVQFIETDGAADTNLILEATQTSLVRGPSQSSQTSQTSLTSQTSQRSLRGPPPFPSRPVRTPSPPQSGAVVPMLLAEDEGPPKVIGAPTAEERTTMLPQPGQFQAPLYAPIRPSRQRPASPKASPPTDAAQPGLQRRPTLGLPGNPRARGIAAAAEGGIQRQQTVMFVNNIVYDDPSTVQSIMQGATADTKNPAPVIAAAAAVHPAEFDAVVETEFVIEKPLKSSNSVLHRPRPIPRKPEKDRVIFPAEQSPSQVVQAHRRSRSQGSIMNRKSILRSGAGSPTQLPPLPPPPKSAGAIARPQPNDTKSMTFDEKMSLFYPGDIASVPSTAVPSTAGRRGSSVPEMPPVPANFFDISETNTQLDGDGGDGEDRKSRSTFRTTVKTDSILDVDEIAPRPGATQSRYTDRSTALGPDDVDGSWIADIESERSSRNRPSVDNVASRRASSPVIPPARDSSWTQTTDSGMNSEDAATTNWGSLHSPAAAVPVQGARLMATATYIQRERAAGSSNETGLMPPPRDLSRISGDGRETMTIMLDPSMSASVSASASGASASAAAPSPEPEGEVLLSNMVYQGWHRRVGDECPTFSERKEKMRSRMPPPTPLLLAGSSTKNPVIVKAAEPSPLESPDHALQTIQAQLKKMEQPNRDSVESQGRRLALLENLENEMNMQEGHWHQMKQDLTRDSLSTLRTASSVDSRPQSLARSPAARRVDPSPRMPPSPTSPPVALLAAAATVPAVAPSAPQPVLARSDSSSSLAAERRAARRDKMRSGSSFRSSSVDGPLAQDMRASVSSRASMWQQRLAEAQIEFMDNAPETMTKRNVNFLTLAQLGSPTPPDSDESDNDSEGGAASMRARLEAHAAALSATVSAAGASQRDHHERPHHPPPRPRYAPPRKSLWKPSAAPAVAAAPTSGLLWTAPARQVPEVRVVEVEAVKPAGASAGRAAPRHVPQRESEPLAIQSSQLWQPSWTAKVNNRRSVSATGMWQPRYFIQSQAATQASPTSRELQTQEQQQQQQKSRPPTIKPPRRSRRVTLLPDILESPEPLPDKRGTLGIFQFPWGERSDTASILPRQTMFAMPGTMTSGGPAFNPAMQARSMQLEADEYSSSFFDDYDDEEDEDEEEEEIDSDDLDEDGSNDGDEFDETTLWEIASLLKTENIPSKNSLLPPRPAAVATGAVVDEYLSDGNVGFEEDGDEARESIIVGLEGEAPAGADAAADSASFHARTVASRLWAAQVNKARGNHGVGVAHPDKHTWSRYKKVAPGETARAKPRPAPEPAVLESSSLWEAPTTPPCTPEAAEPGMWAGAKKIASPSAPPEEKPASSYYHAHIPRSASQGSKGRKQQRPTRSVSLWAPVAAVADPVQELGSSTGMFQPRPKPLSNRSTSAPAAAIGMVRKARSPERKPVDQLASSNLWAAADAAAMQPEHDWMSRSQTGSPQEQPELEQEQRQEADVATALLWTPPAEVEEVEEATSAGLFRPQPKADEAQTTLEPAAAIASARKSRSPERKPLDQLASSTLWTATDAASSKEERIWISQSTSPPPQPPQPQQQQEAVLDTKVDDLWTPPSPVVATPGSDSGMFQLRPRTVDNRRTTSLPAAAVGMIRKARSPVRKSLDKLSSTSLWTAESPSPSSAERRNWTSQPQHQTVSSPSSHAHRGATTAEWEAALHEAVLLSTQRKNATTAEWAAALDKAILESTFDPSKTHPVFAASSLHIASENFHPAATGYIHDGLEEADDTSSSGRAMILAQIEALEQEKMFAEQVVRQSMALADGETALIPLPGSTEAAAEEKEAPPVPSVPEVFQPASPNEAAPESQEWTAAPEPYQQYYAQQQAQQQLYQQQLQMQQQYYYQQMYGQQPSPQQDEEQPSSGVTLRY